MMRRTLQRAIGFGAAFLLALGSASHANAQDKDPIKIAVFNPLSGANAELGHEALTGEQIAIEFVNSQGGVNGRKVEAIEVDVHTPDIAASEATRLFGNEGYRIGIGTYGSSLAATVSAMARRYGAFYMEVSSGSPQIAGNALPYVAMRTSGFGSYADVVGRAMKEWIAPKLGKDVADIKVAIVGEDSAFGSTLRGVLIPELKRAGVKLVLDDAYNFRNIKDFTPIILRLKNAEPDVVLAASYPADAILFWRQTGEQGYTPPFMIGFTAGYSSYKFTETFGAGANGVMSVDANIFVNPKALTPNAVKLTDYFLSEYKKRTGQDIPTTHAAYAFTGTYMFLADILPKAKDPNNRDQVKDAALSTEVPAGSYPLGVGWKMQPTDSADSPHMNTPSYDPKMINQWQDGKFVVVFPPEYATTEAINVPMKAR